MAYTSRFNFTGELIIPDEQRKPESFVKFWKGGAKNETDMARIRFGIKESDSSSCFVECFGMEYDTIKARRDDGENIDVSWDERFDEEILKSIPNYRKYIVDLGELTDGEKQFLSQYDFIKYLYEVLPKYDGKVYCSGRFTKSPYNGEVYDKYTIDTVKESTAKTNSMHVVFDYFWNKDCVDTTEFESTRRIIVDGYIKQYVNKDEGEKFFPQKMVVDVGRLEASEDENHKKYAKGLVNWINVKDKSVIHIPWDCKIIRGAETVELDESMLTDAQREQIECGISTIKDFVKPLSENVYEFRAFKRKLSGDYADGPIDSGYTLDDIQEELFTNPVAKETVADISAIVEEESEDNFDKSLEDLIG